LHITVIQILERHVFIKKTTWKCYCNEIGSYCVLCYQLKHCFKLFCFFLVYYYPKQYFIIDFIYETFPYSNFLYMIIISSNFKVPGIRWYNLHDSYRDYRNVPSHFRRLQDAVRKKGAEKLKTKY
jgi:hypothetical protein